MLTIEESSSSTHYKGSADFIKLCTASLRSNRDLKQTVTTYTCLGRGATFNVAFVTIPSVPSLPTNKSIIFFIIEVNYFINYTLHSISWLLSQD